MLKRMSRKYAFPKVIESRSREHFIQAVHDFSHGPLNHLLVWGGDGTAHDAINALMTAGARKRGKAVGFLRGGTGNGIQDSYMVPFRTSRQLAAYAQSTAKSLSIDVDLLSVRQGAFEVYAQLTGFGFDADVLSERDRISRKAASAERGSEAVSPLPGFGKYLSSATRTFLRLGREQAMSYQIQLQQGKYGFKGTRVNAEFPFSELQMERSPVMLEIGTRPYYGKLFKVCPDVVCNDGFIDCYLYNFEDRISIVRNLGLIWTGKHHRINRKFAEKRKPLIERYEVKRAIVSSNEAFSFHVDGELRRTNSEEDGIHRVEIGIEAQAIRFLVPETFYHIFHPIAEEAALVR
jgi:diacylglycerol kinase family enzyme